MADKELEKMKEVFARMSKVTPKGKLKFTQTTVFKVVIGISLVFLIFGYFSKSAESKEPQESNQNLTQTDDTLNQNLAKLSALKHEEEVQKQKESEAIMIARLNKATHNYTSTPDGKKIGNPKFYKDEPPKRGMNRDLKQRMSAPTTFINVEYADNQVASVTDANNIEKDNKFINKDNAIGFAKALKIEHPDFTLAAGEVIAATLESAINSQLPGMIRAITKRDIYSLNGRRKLIPSGSMLVGQYAASGIEPTQNRLLITWTRIQLPDGVIVTLNSPSTDSLGQSGSKADSVDTHFFERFGSSILFSVLGAYTANAGVNGYDNYNSASQYRMSIVESLQKTANDSLNKNTNLPPTLRINQGAEINVFVARDLSFYDVLHGDL